MMKQKTLRRTALIVTLTAMIALLCTACSTGAKTSPASAASSSAATAEMAQYDMAQTERGAVAMSAGNGMDEGNLSTANTKVKQDDRKIIYEAYVSIESLNYDETLQALKQAVEKANGYVSSTDLYADSWEGALRRATYILRIPSDQYSAFLVEVGQAGNVTQQQESTQDITMEYVDVEARLKSLRTQEERLMAMLEEAGELETLLAVQNQLTDVQYEIERYTAQQRTYDNQVSYSTVTVAVEEVRHITEQKETFGDRISAAFRESWRNFADGIQSFAVWLIYALPTLLVLGVVITVAVVILLKVYRKAQKQRPAMPQPPYAPPRMPYTQPPAPSESQSEQSNEDTK